MTKFININNDTVINISEMEGIQKVELDISEEDFKVKEIETGKEITLDYREFVLAKILLRSGRSIELNTVIYSDEYFDEQIEESWGEFIKNLDCKYIEL